MDRPIVITSRHRDAVYDTCLDRLSGLDDLWSAILGEEYDAAERLGREFSDDLRLILDDLGWGDATGPVTLTLPPADLRRIFLTLRDHAARSRAGQEKELVRAKEILDRADLVTAACDQVLAAVSSGP